jgi:hypothetical protein
LATVTLVLVFSILLLPFFRRFPEWIHTWFAHQPPWQRILSVFLFSSVSVSILFNVLSPRIAHLRAFWLHPPVWSAWAVGILLACIGDLIFGFGPEGFQASAWEWLLYGPGSIAIVAGYRWLTDTKRSDSQPVVPVKELSLQNLADNWEPLEQWLRSECPSEVDLLGNRRLALSLEKYVLRQSGTIGLVGAFGSGKSTLINWLKAEVDSIATGEHPTIWFCDLTCWGFQDSTSAIHDILSKAVATVNRHADCFSIRHLPEAYRKTFSAAGDWVRNLIDLVIGSADPMEQFKHLNQILTSVNARLVIIVEELERTNNSRFDRQEILALLHRLKSLDRVSFILTGGWTSTPEIEFAKLCDHIEIMAEVDREQVANIIQAVRLRCLKRRQLDVGPAEENPWHPVHFSIMNRVEQMPLCEAAARLLRTPRALKHALRRTLRAWEALCGEIDFDDLLAVNILRHAAPEAFDFIIRRWNRLSDDPRGWSTDQQRIPALRKQTQSEWDKACHNADWDSRAARTLVVFSLPPAGEYLLEEGSTRQHRPQGLSDWRYWRRAINEEIDPNEARDQDVLQDLRQWFKTRQSESPLVGRLIGGGDYVTVWENLAVREFQPPGTLLLELADQVIASFRNPRGATISEMNEHPAFLALWRRANRIVRRGPESADWLRTQLGKAIPKSLSLLNDLYYYWASLQNGIILREDRSSIQECIYTLARDQWRDENTILQVAHPEQRYDFYQLVFPPGDHQDGLSLHRGVKAWNWLAPILLDAFEQNPKFIAPKIACLVAQRIDGEHPGMYRYQLSYELLTGFFDSSSEHVSQLLMQARDVAIGENREFLDQVVRSSNGVPIANR